MDPEATHMYQFDGFLFDADRFALYHDGNVVKNAGTKPLAVLAALLNNANQLVTYDEIIERVWADNPHGATSARVNQYASKLQKLFAEFAPDSDYLENVPGRGYIFKGHLTSNAANQPIETSTGDQEPDTLSDPQTTDRPGLAERKSPRAMAVYALAFVAIFAAAFAWYLYPTNDDIAIRLVVKDSQIYESLVLYENPTAFVESDLDRYWTSDIEANVNYDRRRIRDSVNKMISEGRKYGVESRCDQFEFQSVEIDKNNNTAVVKTLEKWFVAVYQNDGTLLKNRTIGPYFVSYVLKKVSGRWLIEKSTTGRVNRPIPRISEIEVMSEAKAGQQFLVKVIGQDFEVETIAIEVVGPGCPELKPCKVPNSVLRESAKLSDTAMSNIPLTLASGNFKLFARNGDSQPSEAMSITVP